ncbi:MAG TPA: DPP IV N-terminal domain-containing protein [Vicinamibacterales bacterium]|nr:DPP IV N-terminal domain-containing protein [Vicinamibacterales bacterium]
MKLQVRLLLTILVLLFAAAAPRAQQGPAAPAAVVPNYELASRWASSKVGKMVFSTGVSPQWLEHSDRFWYEFETPAGKRWWMVDPVKRTRVPLWDNAKMAAQLTTILRTPYDAQHLPISAIKFFDKDTVIRFAVDLPKEATVSTDSVLDMKMEVKTEEQLRQEREQQQEQQQDQQQERQGARPAETKKHWLQYDLATGKVVLLQNYEPEKEKARWAAVSPDKQTIVFARGHNLYMMDAAEYAKAQKEADDPALVETQLTTDGLEDYSYARDLRTEEDRRRFRPGKKDERDTKIGPRVPAITVYWSQDSKKFAVSRNDARKVGDLWVINALANPRPTLETYKYGMPGEANQPQAELAIIDIGSRQLTPAKTAAFVDQQLSVVTAPMTSERRAREETEPQWVASDAGKLYFTRTSRDLKRIDIVELDTATGESKPIIQERSNTYVEIQPLRLVNAGKELIHWSERDGWGHYYLYAADGTLKRQITSGEFVCTGIEGFDDKTRTLYFTAAGREPGQDPYYEHLYRVNVDTGDLKLLTQGEVTHNAAMNDKAAYYVSTSSRVDRAPEAALFDAAGTKVMDLEKADVSALVESGFKFPEPFKVKADDGITDLYGVMYKPFDFDPAKQYPVIAFVYPGPQTESVTKAFSPRSQNVALAQLGFIVIEVGNRGGNPSRSKWYHNYGYGNLRDYGLADKKAAIEQLARRHSFVDAGRVGIYGHSGGGFMSTAAMLVYPDFFKVAVSSAGNHENNIYNRWWSEKHHGVKESEDKDGKIKFEYDIARNSQIAKNLKGRLLLIHGDIDNNVHPANTLRLVDALIKANKRFDMLIVPGKRHGFADAGDYVFWVRADYFARHLLGSAADSVDILELNREREIKR